MWRCFARRRQRKKGKRISNWELKPQLCFARSAAKRGETRLFRNLRTDSTDIRLWIVSVALSAKLFLGGARFCQISRNVRGKYRHFPPSSTCSSSPGRNFQWNVTQKRSWKIVYRDRDFALNVISLDFFVAVWICTSEIIFVIYSWYSIKIRVIYTL